MDARQCGLCCRFGHVLICQSGVVEIQENKRYFYSIKYEQYNNDEMKNDEM